MHPRDGKFTDDIFGAIGRFLSGAKVAAAMEPGEDPILLKANNIMVESRGSLVTFSCWTDTRNLVRRLRRVRSARIGRLELEYDKFGNTIGVLTLIDLAHPSNRDAPRRGARLKYREVFRRALRRQFVDWKLMELSAEQDLEHSLSPAYPRAFLKKGSSAWAAIGAGEDALDPDGALSFGLIWLDYLRRRERKLVVEGLAVFLMSGKEATTCHRVRHLDDKAARYRVFVHHSDGLEDAVDPGDYTNLKTRLSACSVPLARTQPDVSAWVRRLETIDSVSRRDHPDGSVSFSVRGLEFARATDQGLAFGLDRQHHAASANNLTELEELAKGIARLRRAKATDRVNPLYAMHPEAWLESQVRAGIQQIDATLNPAPVYGQVPQFVGGERGVIDLLASDDTGRLTVLELKAAQDIHLPLQALDYWMRVKSHLEQGDFSRAGYFPGTLLSQDSPRLFLIAPALEFHPTNETILRYFSPVIEVDRIGIGLEWREQLRIMFRSGSNSLWRSQSSTS